ncbi:MAG: SDR family oxidoreductase [Actinomycetota bacterium]|nr:SDR family oxidoreductase [Actinomycetota bacterium]
MDLGLSGKKAIVTGGSSGIGKEIARTLAVEGMDVVIVARGRARLEAAAKELSADTGRKIIPLSADVSSTEQVNAMVQQAAAALGQIDVLVNSGAAAGVAAGKLSDVVDEGLMGDLNTKVLGYLRSIRAVAPHMQRQHWGRIINIGGLAARQGGSYSTGMRNIAVVHMAKTLSQELGPHGITVNVVHPGATKGTPNWDTMVEARRKGNSRSTLEVETEISEAMPIRRPPDVQDVAYLVAFLASPKAGAITGEAISTGGGSGPGVIL